MKQVLWGFGLVLGLMQNAEASTRTFGITDDAIGQAMKTGHQVQVWEIEAPYAGVQRYEVEVQHAAVGPVGAFSIVAWTDTKGDGKPDKEVARSSVLQAKAAGEWSRFAFDNHWERVFVGNTWDDPSTVIYYASGASAKAVKGLSTKLFYSRQPGGMPHSSTGPRMTRMRVRALGEAGRKVALANSAEAAESAAKSKADTGMSVTAAFREGMKWLEHDPERAERFLLDAASRDHAPAAFNLGQLYVKSATADDESACRKAVPLWRQAANEGLAEAQYNLAVLLRDGKGVAQNPSAARSWFYKAAMQGQKEAQYDYAIALEDGVGGPQDTKGALKWLRLAADKGHPAAQSRLGFYYLTGRGVEKNIDLAMRLTLQAANHGDRDAMNNMAKLYLEGIGVPRRDARIAAVWYEKAAKKGHAEAANTLGRLYFEGKGVALDRRQAQQWWLEAAQENLAAAQYNIGNYRFLFPENALLERGESLKWLRKAAEQGHTGAIRALSALVEH